MFLRSLALGLVVAAPVTAFAQDQAAAPATAETTQAAAAATEPAATPAPAVATGEPVLEKAQGEAKLPEASETKISGKVYADITRKAVLDQSAPNAKAKRVAGNGTGVDLKRFYAGVAHKFDKTWSAEIVSDIGDQNGKYDIFVKKAYIQAKAGDEAVVRVGAANMPWIPFVEDLYGYRYIENTLIDRLKFGTSSDWGAHFSGAALGKKVNYALSGVNGGGYGNPTRSESQDLDLAGRFGVTPIEGLNFAVGGYRGKLAKDAPTKHVAMRVDGLAAYNHKRFNVGVEYFQAANWTTVDKPAEDHARGLSGWASVVVYEPVSVFGRYDWAKPSLDVNKDLVDSYILGGVEYKVNKAVNLALAYKNETVKGGQIKTSNGTIGTVKKDDKGTYDEYGLWAQYKF